MDQPPDRIELHVLAPCADLETVVSIGDSLSDYQRAETEQGRPCLTEWGPEQRRFLTERCQLVAAIKSIHWHMTTLLNYEQLLDDLVERQHQLIAADGSHRIVVMSLADGGETDGWPGVSVIRALENRPSLPFTGASSLFFELDTVKNRIKSHMASGGCNISHLTPRYVDTAPSSLVQDGSALAAIRQLSMPVIVKPSLSSGSRGINANSVVFSAEEAFRIVGQLNQEFGGSYVEEFIAGPEFTCLIMGDSQNCRTFTAAQRCFRSTLPVTQQFLYFDMKWNEWGMNDAAGKSWWYAVAPASYQERIQQTAKEVYRAVGGNGYARMDLRMDQRNGKMYVIDVNANCSMDGDDESALGTILRGEGCGLPTVIEQMINDALDRQSAATAADKALLEGQQAGKGISNKYAVASNSSVASSDGVNADDNSARVVPARRLTTVSAC